ncbi:sulfurtransferase TusA family protein [Verrucomicrobiota bacterium]
MSEIVDARGLSCPVPVIKTKAAIETTTSNEIVVLVDEEVAKENVSRLAGSLGCKVEVTQDAEEFKLVIQKEARE